MKLVSYFIFRKTAADLQVLAGVLNNTVESCEGTKVVREVKMVILHEEFYEHPQINGTYFNDIAIIMVGLLFKYKT